MIHAVAEQAMRPISREYDEREHEKPWDFLNMMWEVSSGNPIGGGRPQRRKDERPAERNLGMCVAIEELSWGDAGLYLSIPNPGLGGAAVAAAGTPEQKERFLARFKGGKPKWARDGDHRAGLRLGLLGDPDHGRARRRPLGAERHQDLLHQRPDGGREVGRLRRRLGDARPLGRPRRHQGLRRRGRTRPACT